MKVFFKCEVSSRRRSIIRINGFVHCKYKYIEYMRLSVSYEKLVEVVCGT